MKLPPGFRLTPITGMYLKNCSRITSNNQAMISTFVGCPVILFLFVYNFFSKHKYTNQLDVMMWISMMCCISWVIRLWQWEDNYYISATHQSKGMQLCFSGQVSVDISDDFSVQTDMRAITPRSLRFPVKPFMLPCKRQHILWNLQQSSVCFTIVCSRNEYLHAQGKLLVGLAMSVGSEIWRSVIVNHKGVWQCLIY